MRLILDPTHCDGAGLCAELFPEGIVLDDWGYPIVDSGEIPRELEVLARHAVSSCPKLALRLVRHDPPQPARRDPPQPATVNPPRRRQPHGAR